MRLTLVLAVTLLFSPVAAFAQTLYVAETDVGFLNMRNGPGTQFDIVRRLSPGDRVAVEETQGVWYAVRLPDGQRGWVSGDFLERGDAAAGLLFVSRNDEGYLNLRDGPSTETEVLRRMYPGDRLQELERRGRWIRVRHVSGAEGWAFGAFVSR